MKNLLLLFFVSALACSPKIEEEVTAPDQDYVVIGYVAGWKTLNPKKIPVDKLTHINYAFADVKDGVVTHIGDRKEKDSLNFVQLRRLKEINPELKLLVSIGGWTNSKGFSEAVSSPEGIKKLTQSGIEFLQKYHLDGLDFDWEYPGLLGDDNPHKPEDKENFVAMLRSFREALDSLGAIDDTHYLSTIASGGFRKYLEANDMAEAQKYLDLINIMTYDFYTGSDEVTGHHANLHGYGGKGASAEKAVKEHVEFGVPAEKIVLGVPFYGRMWRQVGADQNGLDQPGAYAMGLPYHQVLALSKNSNYQRFWDEAAEAPYLYSAKDSTWITYEDEESLQGKMQFVKDHKLAGAMFWELSEDNTRRLLNALNTGIRGEKGSESPKP